MIMDQTKFGNLKQTLVDELGVMEEDIHVVEEESALTCYVPDDELDRARSVVDTKVVLIEEHLHEYLVRVDIWGVGR